MTSEHARRERGFTLIELLITILIIGILAAVSLAVFNGQRAKAWDRQAGSALEDTVRQARSVFTDDETYPADVAVRIAAGEPTVNVVAGTGHTEGQVAVERLTTSKLLLRTQSRSGVNLLIADDAATGRTQRMKGDGGSMDLQPVTNQESNPSAEVDTVGVNASGGATVSRSTSWASSGNASFLCSGSTTGAAGTYCVSTNFAVTPGQPYSFSVELNVTAVPPTGVIGVYLSYYTSGGALIGAGSTIGSSVNTTGQRRITASGTAPATAASAHLSFHAYPTASAQPFSFYVDSLISCQCAEPPVYFDGDSPAGTWTGTVGRSTSVGPASSSSF